MSLLDPRIADALVTNGCFRGCMCSKCPPRRQGRMQAMIYYQAFYRAFLAAKVADVHRAQASKARQELHILNAPRDGRLRRLDPGGRVAERLAKPYKGD